MCSFCGPAPTSPGWFDAGVPEDLAARLRARETLVRVARAVTDPRVVTVQAQPGGPAVSVQTRDGRSASITDFGMLWAGIETLTGHAVAAVDEP